MNIRVPETMSNPTSPRAEAGRRHHGADDHLILSELHPDAVLDHLERDSEPLNLISFGNMREVCPKCGRHLKLVLRQRRVRKAHLFCAGCESCFDAHYANGQPALSI